MMSMGTLRRTTTRNKVTLILILCLCALLAGCVVASTSTQTYTVQPGDTLARIAQANGTTVEKLVELNKETYPSLATDPGAIEVGWTLKLPGGAVTAPVKVIVKTPDAGAQPTAQTNVLIGMDRDAFEREVVRLINEERTKAGLASLEADPELMQFARERSEDMVKRGYFGHNDPVTGEELYVSMLRTHNIHGLIAENATQLLQTTMTDEANAIRAVSNWVKSEGHRTNLMEPTFHKTGVGVAIGDNYIIVTQLFAE